LASASAVRGDCPMLMSPRGDPSRTMLTAASHRLAWPITEAGCSANVVCGPPWPAPDGSQMRKPPTVAAHPKTRPFADGGLFFHCRFNRLDDRKKPRPAPRLCRLPQRQTPGPQRPQPLLGIIR
jgi:hypothetical protein